MEQSKSWNRSKVNRDIIVKTKMKKIGITGSLASGKTTASKILSSRNGPLFSADKIVRNLYRSKKFKKFV